VTRNGWALALALGLGLGLWLVILAGVALLVGMR
jgi:hypothetical protein